MCGTADPVTSEYLETTLGSFNAGGRPLLCEVKAVVTMHNAEFDKNQALRGRLSPLPTLAGLNVKQP